MMAATMRMAQAHPLEPSALHLTAKVRRHSDENDVTLPKAVDELKKLIRATHPAKSYAFSLIHMRKVAVPPVQIPDEYRLQKGTTLMVSGREVPYTRLMWLRDARARLHRLDTIKER